ncbi:HIT domain-containing protein [Patescibacteria group bacterium]|nr:HIT domain-containing protein [Patescibacteria group bacterium]MBU1755250.1 HIT domain-containing protein [Patescibacteria group bacterium]
MYNHAPEGYICPICLAVQGIESEQTMAKQSDIVYRDALTLVYVNSKFVGNNPGHVIVVPTAHFENLYDLPVEYAHAIVETSQKLAQALKAVRKCDGVWIEQNNEPASGQHAFHYHMHIIPRFEDDDLRNELAKGNTRVTEASERLPYAEALRAYLGT